MGSGQRRRLRWAVAAIVVVGLAAAVGGHLALGGESSTTARVGTAAVDRGPVTAEIAATGAVQPTQHRSLTFAVAGTVSRVTVRAGQEVTAGEVLAEIDDADARDRVTEAAEVLAEAQDTLDEAEDGQNTGDGGSTCLTAAGQPGQVQLAGYAAATVTPSASPSPTATTAPTGRATPTGRASSTPRAAAPTGGSCTGERSGGGDAVLTAAQRVNAATRDLAEARAQLAGTVITAPKAGKVLSVAGKVGSSVSAGGTFIEFGAMGEAQVQADFPEADAGRLRTGQRAVVMLADRAGEEFAAEVIQVDPVGTADGSMVRYGTVLAFDTTPEDLLVGQSAGVRVSVAEASGVLRVPASAVHDIHDGTATVLVRAADGDQRRTVSIGLRGDRYVEIRSGLAEGDTVLTTQES